jgi:adenylate cyclase
MRKKLLRGTFISISIALLATFLYLFGFFSRIEWLSYDYRMRLFKANSNGHPDVVVILIDEASLRAMNPLVGRWPWPRSIFADLIEFLAMGGAKAVAFDILFTENERGYGLSAGEISPNDRRLIDSTGEFKNVYHAFQLLVDEEDEFNKNLLNRPLPEDFKAKLDLRGRVKLILQGKLFLTLNNNYYIPMPDLYKAARGAGVVEFAPDTDGVYRRTMPFREYQDGIYPALSMAPLIDILKPGEIALKEGNLFIDDLSIPVNKGSYLINMYGRFNTYSMSGILASIQKIRSGDIENLMVNPDEFKDKIVFVGASAVGVEDLKATPISNKTPGVFLHASIVSNMLYKDFLNISGRVSTIIVIFILSLITGLAILSLNRFYIQVILPVILSIIYSSWVIFLFKNNMVSDLVPPIFTIILSWLAAFSYLAFTEGKDKKKVRRMLSQYVSPAVLGEVVDKYEDYIKANIGTKENLTVMFSDIRGFTNMSEVLKPEEVVGILNQYLSAMVDVIFKYNGTLDKFIGDAIMAFWGAPVRTDTHAIYAVDAAIIMTRELHRLNNDFKEKGLPVLDIGVGINTGEVILGNIGSEKKLDFTVIGDNVNLASRLEGLSKVYHSRVLLTESTYNKLYGKIPCRLIDMVRVKGRVHPVKIYGVLCSSSDPEDIIKGKRAVETASREAFDAYLKRDWNAAVQHFNEILAINPGDEISKKFIKVCNEYVLNEPPLDWEGVHIYTSK